MTGLLPPTPAVLRAYRLSTYRAGPVTARIGRSPTGMQSWTGTFAMLSGANPGGRRMPDGWNARAMQRLERALRRTPHWRGEGRLGRWGEPLVLAALPGRPAAVLARRFRQNGIVLLRRGRPARLVLL